jgi:hypothetical protein
MLGMERHFMGWRHTMALASSKSALLATAEATAAFVRPIFRVVFGCGSFSYEQPVPLFFNSSPEIIRLAALMYVKYPLSLRNVEDLLAERGVDISHETVRFWWNRFGLMFATEI